MEPNIAGGYGLGRFQLIYNSGPGTDFIIAAPGGPPYGGFGGVMNTIESGVAFFVAGSATPQSITFNENVKTPSVNQVFFTAQQRKDCLAILSVRNAGIASVVDGATASFDKNFSDKVDYDDAVKMNNMSENISFKRNNTLLAIERRMMPAADDTLFINISSMGIKDYQWTFKLKNMDAPGLTGFVKDAYLNTTAALNLSGDNIIDFSVTADHGSYAADRFMIVFKPAAVLPLSVRMVSAKREKNETITVKWKAESELNVAGYEIERSADGTTFNKVGSASANNTGNATAYVFSDVKPFAATIYYRIKIIKISGENIYTAVVKVAPAGEESFVLVNPNPVKNNVIHLQAENLSPGKYNVQLFNSIGAVVYSSVINITSDSFIREIKVSGNIAHGSYTLSIGQKAGPAITSKLIFE